MDPEEYKRVFMHSSDDDLNDGMDPKDYESESSGGITVQKKRRKQVRNEFIDDEAELSGDDVVSEDENVESDDEELDKLGLVDKEAPELDSDQEEEVRELYLKQLATEDRRDVLLLREHFEDKTPAFGSGRQRKFKWQTRALMEKFQPNMQLRYDPAAEGSDDTEGSDDSDDDLNYAEMKPALKRRLEAVTLGNQRIVIESSDDEEPSVAASRQQPVASTSYAIEDGNSAITSSSKAQNSISNYVYRDRGIVEALSTRQAVTSTREERDRLVNCDMQRLLQSSVFDQLDG